MTSKLYIIQRERVVTRENIPEWIEMHLYPSSLCPPIFRVPLLLFQADRREFDSTEGGYSPCITLDEDC